MKKKYMSPCLKGMNVVMPQPVLAGGSIDNMQYGSNNVFGDDDDESKERNVSGYEWNDVQSSLW